jgi:hypothetical protein
LEYQRERVEMLRANSQPTDQGNSLDLMLSCSPHQLDFPFLHEAAQPQPMDLEREMTTMRADQQSLLRQLQNAQKILDLQLDLHLPLPMDLELDKDAKIPLKPMLPQGVG